MTSQPPLFLFAAESFWKNPQFELSLTEQDNKEDEEEDDEDSGDSEDDVDNDAGGGGPSEEEKKRAEKKEKRSKQCTVLVELLQKNRRRKGKVHFLYIAFHVYKVTPLLLQSLFQPPSLIVTHGRSFSPVFTDFSRGDHPPKKLMFNQKSLHPSNVDLQ